MGWKCTRCPSSNDDDSKFVCPACGYLDEARKDELALSTLDLPLPPGPWTCGACTMENPETAHACFVCGTADDERRKRLGGREGGSSMKALTPEILSRVAIDDYFSLIDLLTDLCQTLAIARAALEAGIDRMHLDPAYVPILLDIMRNARQSEGAARGQGWSGLTNLDVALLACRALNYFLGDLGVRLSEIIRLGGLTVLLDCFACFSGSRSQFSAAMDLSEETMKGLEMLYSRLRMQSNASLRDSHIDMEFIRLLTNYVQVCISSSTGPASEARRQVPSGELKGISRALMLLRLLLGSHWKVQHSSNSSQTPSTFPEKDSVLSALYMVTRYCGTQPEAQDQIIAALSLLASVVVPCLRRTGNFPDIEPLVTDYNLLAKCMSDSASMTGVQCASVDFAYQLLTCPELCEVALRPPAPICTALCQLMRSIGIGANSAGNRTNCLTPSVSSSNQPCSVKLRSGGVSSISDGMTSCYMNQYQCMGLGLVRLAGLIGFVMLHGFLPPFLKLGNGADTNRNDGNKLWYSPGEEVEVNLVSPRKKAQGSGKHGEGRMAKSSPPRIMGGGKNKTGQLLAELGNGTCLVCWGDGHENIIPCNRIAPRLSFAAQAQLILSKAIRPFAEENTGCDGNNLIFSLSNPSPADEELAATVMLGGLLRFGGKGKREPGGLGPNNTARRGGWGGGQLLLHHILKQSIKSGNLSMLHKAIAKGADVNASFPKSGLLPLMMAILSHKQTDVLLELVQALLDGGADPNIAGAHGTTALHCASRLGFTKVVHVLLNSGANVNARDDEDLSPLDVCPEEETLLALTSHIDSSESKNNPDVEQDTEEAKQPGGRHDEYTEVEETEGVIKPMAFGITTASSTLARDQVNPKQESSSHLVYIHPDLYPLQQVAAKEPASPVVISSTSKVELGRALLQSLIIGCEPKVLSASLAPLGKAWLTVTLGILHSSLEDEVFLPALLEPETQSAVLNIVGTLLDNSECGSNSSTTTQSQCSGSSSSSTTTTTTGRTRRTGLQSQALALLIFTLRRWPESNLKLFDRLGIIQKVSSLSKRVEKEEDTTTTDPVFVASRAVMELFNQLHVGPHEQEGPNLQDVCSSLMTELMTRRSRMQVVNVHLEQLERIVSGTDGVTPFEAQESKLVDVLLELPDNALIQAAKPSLVNLCRQILGTIATSQCGQGKTKVLLPFLSNNRGSSRDTPLSSGLLIGIGGRGGDVGVVARPISLQLRAHSRNTGVPGAHFHTMDANNTGIFVTIASDTFTHELRRFLLGHVILQNPSYVTYCRRIVGKMVRIWNGPHESSHRQPPQWKYQSYIDNHKQQPGRLLGREVKLSSQQPSGCTIYRVLGFDSITGTHLLKCIPIPVGEEKVGIPKASSPEQYIQVVLAECFYQVLISDEEREDYSVSGPSSLSPSINEATTTSSSTLSHGKDRFPVGSDRSIQVATGLPVSGEGRTTEAGIDDDSVLNVGGSHVDHDILLEIGTGIEENVLLQGRKDVVVDGNDSFNRCTTTTTGSCSHLRPQLEEEDAGVLGCNPLPSSTTSNKHLPQKQQQQSNYRVWLQQSSNLFLWVSGSVVGKKEFRLDDAPPNASLVRRSEIKNVMEFPSAKMRGGKRKNHQQRGSIAFLGGSASRQKHKKDSDGTDRQGRTMNDLMLRVQHACSAAADGDDDQVDCISPISPRITTTHDWLSSTPELHSPPSQRGGWGLGRLMQPNKGGKMAKQWVVGFGSSRYYVNEQEGGGATAACKKVNAGENEYKLAKQGWMQPPILKLCVKIDASMDQMTSAPWLELEDTWTICKSLGDLWHMSPVTESNHLAPLAQVQTTTRGSGGILGSRVEKEGTGPAAICLFFDIVVAADSKMISDIEPLPAAPGLKNATFIQHGMSRETDPFCKALLLLRKLRDLVPPSPPILEGGSIEAVNNNVDNIGQEETTAEWINPQLVDMLSEILDDPVCIGSGAVPCWVDAIFCGGGAFLIPWSMRLEYFRRTAFGPMRGLEWLHAANDAATSVEKKLPSNSPPQQESNTSRVKDTVLVNRETLLADADATMRFYGRVWAGLACPSLGLSTVLEYRFSGEKGLGSGVAASFYASVAGMLYERGSCQGIWVDPERQGSQDEHIFHPNGLFPAPLPSDPNRALHVLSKFRLIGRLAARCLLDNHLFPLPLSLDFLELVLCRVSEGTQGPRSLSPMELKRIYLQPAVVVEQLDQVVQKQKLQQEEVGDHVGSLIYGLSLKDFLCAACLSMVDPIDGSPLEQQQHQHQHQHTPPADVSLINVEDYVTALNNRWSRCGWVKQVCIFVEGIRDLFEPSKLLALGAPGLSRQLCGEMDFDWDEVHLLKAVVPGAGYTQDSPPYRDFLSLLAAMPLRDKQHFLRFVTGCPVLPFGGLCSLSPPLTIVRKQGKGGLGIFNGSVESDLPFARTCTHTLHLPPFSNKDLMREQLFYAMVCSADIIDRD